MLDIVTELEAALRPWNQRNAKEAEQAAVNILNNYERDIPNRIPVEPGKDPKVIVAAGGIVWHPDKPERQLALVHRPKYDDWCLPKGKADEGETISQTASREVLEETGCEVELTTFAGIIHYVVKAGPKFVFYWQMLATKVAPLKPNEEIDELKWLTIAEAKKHLTYDIEQEFLLRVVH